MYIERQKDSTVSWCLHTKILGPLALYCQFFPSPPGYLTILSVFAYKAMGNVPILSACPPGICQKTFPSPQAFGFEIFVDRWAASGGMVKEGVEGDIKCLFSFLKWSEKCFKKPNCERYSLDNIINIASESCYIGVCNIVVCFPF